MTLNMILDPNARIIGIWVTDKDEQDIVEAAFENEPLQVYAKGHKVKKINDHPEKVFGAYWQLSRSWGFKPIDPAKLKALWFDEFGSLKVNS